MSDERVMGDVDVVVHAEGAVGDEERAYARDKIADVGRFVSGPVLFAKVDLVVHADPARERPAFAKAELDVNGQMVRANAAATTVVEAIDLLEARLRERAERHAHHRESQHLRHRGDEHEWHHGDLTEYPARYFPRPVDERQIVRRKTFAVSDVTPEEAVLDLEQLDHDFYLFRNVATHEDNVLSRVGERRYELIEPSPAVSSHDLGEGISPSTVRPGTMRVDEAVGMLDLADLPFLFFLDPATRHGSIVYRRYDGNYGLITTDAPPT
jgi:ribosome-associated translation inhibitor RaiA